MAKDYEFLYKLAADLEQEKKQKRIEREKEYEESREKSKVTQKYTFLVFNKLDSESRKMMESFNDNRNKMLSNISQEIKKDAYPEALNSLIFKIYKSHNDYIFEMEKTIKSCSTLDKADQHWQELELKHEEFKKTWDENITKFKHVLDNNVKRLTSINIGENDTIKSLSMEEILSKLKKFEQEIVELKSENKGLLEQIIERNTTIEKISISIEKQDEEIEGLKSNLSKKTEEASEYLDKYHKMNSKLLEFKQKVEEYIVNNDIKEEEQLCIVIGDLEHF